MCAQALLAVAGARPAPASQAAGSQPESDPAHAQPAAWADSGKLPITAHDTTPGGLLCNKPGP